MKIIIGHTNSDLDCIGSIVLAKYLYPDAIPVKSQILQNSTRKVLNLFEHHLNMLNPKDLRNKIIDKIIIVDTKERKRVKEYFKYLNYFSGEIEIWDHHINEKCDFDNAILHDMGIGANVTNIGLELIKKGIKLNNDDATIALAGIFADTGNFTHINVKKEDLIVAAYLVENGASIRMASEFTRSLQGIEQKSLFHELINSLTYKNYQGHFIIFTYLEFEKQRGGLADVLEQIHEIENPDATFGIFYFKKEKSTLIIGRSKKEAINVREILKNFNGGGHDLAASAYIKNTEGEKILSSLEKILSKGIIPAITANDIMTKEVRCINKSWSLLEASLFLEKYDHTGAPVIDNENNLVGFLTLRDIMKGRKANNIKAPVSAYMRTKVIHAKRDITVRNIGKLFNENNIGHLPIVDEKNRVIGIVTRSDLINLLHKREKEEKVLNENLNSIQKLKF